MNGWSFRIGKVFGVEVRLHAFFVFMVAPATVWAVVMGRPPIRGVALWALLLVAVLVREVARGIAAAAFSLDVTSVLLLPTGGLLTYAGVESETRAGQAGVQRGMAVVGPVANLVFGLVLAGLVVTISPAVSLMGMPWVSPAHLLRTLIWVNLLLGVLNFLPAWPLDGGRVIRSEVVRGAAVRGGAAGSAVGQMLPARLQVLVRLSRWIALSFILYGMLSPNLWVMMAGLGILLGAQVERQGLTPAGETDSTRVGDVMLTEYSILPASATLEDAMMAARHSLQDVFPVVRAGNMVGAVGRQSILEALATSGNGYVQGIMTRSFQTAAVGDSLMETLNQAVGQNGGASLQIVPVVDGEAVVGILTPQHLQRSLGLLPRRLLRAGKNAAGETD
jgi:Zn-dependent protease/predicted transcriptional regulator